jgi:hypothetical protein
MRAIARDPSARYETAEAMRLDLDAFARSRKLDLSPFRIGALMERVFAPQLEAWRSSQREGRSLSEHVAAFRNSRPMDVVDLAALGDISDTEPDDPPTPIDHIDARAPTMMAPTAELPAPAPAPVAPRGISRGWQIVIGIAATPLLLLVGIGIWSVIDARSRPGAALAAPAQAPAPVEAPRPMVEPIEVPKEPPKAVVEPAPATAEPTTAEPAVDEPAIEIEPVKQKKKPSEPVKKRPAAPPRITKTAPPLAHPAAPAPSPTTPPPAPTTTPPHAVTLPATAPPSAPTAPPDPDAPLPR